MWLLVFFDLPTKTKKQRRAYTRLRKVLLLSGFHMRQFSFYEIYCPTKEVATQYQKRIINHCLEKGKETLLSVTSPCRTCFYAGYLERM